MTDNELLTAMIEHDGMCDPKPPPQPVIDAIAERSVEELVSVEAQYLNTVQAALWNLDAGTPTASLNELRAALDRKRLERWR